MRKLSFPISLLLLALAGSGTANAQSCASEDLLDANMITDGMKIVLEHVDPTRGGRYFNGASTKYAAGICKNSNVCTVEKASDDGDFYLINDGKYIAKTSSTTGNISVTTNKDEAAIFIAVTPVSGGSGIYNANVENNHVAAGYRDNKAHLVRFVTYVNNDKTGSYTFLNGNVEATQWAAGNGGSSYVYVYTEETAKKIKLAALSTQLTTFYSTNCGIDNPQTQYGYYTLTEDITSTYTTVESYYTSATTTTTTLDEIYNQTTTLANAFSAHSVNLPPTGKFLRIQSTNTGNYYLSAGNTTQKSGSDEVAQSCADADASTIFYYGDTSDAGSGTYLLNYSTGYHLANNAGFLYYNGYSATPASITFAEGTMSTPGQLQVNFYNGNANRALFVGDDSRSYKCDAGGANTAEQGYNFYVTEVTTLPVTISSAGAATFYAPVAVKLPTDGSITAYTGAVEKNGDNDVLKLTEVTDGIIPANTGVVLFANEGDYNFDITDEAGTKPTTNDLTGAAATAALVEGSLTLQNNGGLGFYTYAADSDNENPEMKGFKAYLPGTAVNGTRALAFDFSNSGTTGIEFIDTDNHTADSAAYDLSGRRVNKLGKGLYLVNGKKILVK